MHIVKNYVGILNYAIDKNLQSMYNNLYSVINHFFTFNKLLY